MRREVEHFWHSSFAAAISLGNVHFPPSETLRAVNHTLQPGTHHSIPPSAPTEPIWTSDRYSRTDLGATQ